VKLPRVATCLIAPAIKTAHSVYTADSDFGRIHVPLVGLLRSRVKSAAIVESPAILMQAQNRKQGMQE